MKRLVDGLCFLLPWVLCGCVFSESEDSTALDCRNQGSECGAGFQCREDVLGDYTCQPVRDNNSPQMSAMAPSSAMSATEAGNAQQNSSAADGESSVVANYSCCLNGRFYQCPNGPAVDRCGNGFPGDCQIDSTRDSQCMSSSSEDNTDQFVNRCAPHDSSCEINSDCCQDVLTACVAGTCTPTCTSDGDCRTGCCASWSSPGSSESGFACAPIEVCGTCQESGEECGVNGDCCSFWSGLTICAYGFCADLCNSGDECVSGCCAATVSTGGDQNYVCSEPTFCDD